MAQNYLQQSDFIALKSYRTKTCDTEKIISQDLIPSQDRRWNLGTSTLAFNEIHAKKVFVDSDTLYIGPLSISVKNGKLDLGSNVIVKNTNLVALVDTLLSGSSGQFLVAAPSGYPTWQTVSAGPTGDQGPTGTQGPTGPVSVMTNYQIRNNGPAGFTQYHNLFNSITINVPSVTATYMLSGTVSVFGTGNSTCFFTFGIESGNSLTTSGINVIGGAPIGTTTILIPAVSITFVPLTNNSNYPVHWNHIYTPGGTGNYTLGIYVCCNQNGVASRGNSQFNIVQLTP
jgi:hypothetical protein